MHSKIVFCQGTYEERIEETKKCVERVKPGVFVDRAVIIVDETVTEESKQWLVEHNCEVYTVLWTDDFPAMRNAYLSKLNYGDYCCCSDPDELYCEELCRDLRFLIAEAEKNSYGLLLLNSHDVLIKLDGTTETVVSNFFKNLIFKYLPGVYYEGAGRTRNIHEILRLPPNTKVWTLPRKYFYEHIKTELAVLERSFRNVFIGGGGINVGSANPHFFSLRKITHALGLNTWSQLREYLRRGNIAKPLLDWIISIKDLHGFDWEDETQQCFNYYKTIHPEELESIEANPRPLTYGSQEEVMAYVEKCYLEILGRHADDEGKKTYTEHILKGRIRREDLPSIFMRSEEYRRKGLGLVFCNGTDWDKEVDRVLQYDREIFFTHSPMVDKVARYKPSGKVLDAGCGIGRFIEVFKSKGFQYVGIDQSGYAIETAKRFHSDDTFIQAFLWDIDFKDEFDVIFSNAVLQHNTLDGKKKILHAFYRALKPSGILCFAESTVKRETRTQLTYEGWLNLVRSFGFNFLESFHKNEFGLDDNYIFYKPPCFCKKWDAYLAIAKKVESGGRGDDYAPPENLSWLVDLFAKYIPPAIYPSILSVGAGAGSEVYLLNKKGYKAVGITLGIDNISRAKREFDIHLIEMDMHNLFFPEKTFDGAVMIQVFEHALSWYALLGELYFVLRDGGRVMVNVPLPTCEEIKTIWHTNLLYPEQVEHCFNVWGFKIIEIEENKNRGLLFFEKLPENHTDWKMYSYIRHVIRLRRELEK
ncbi:MAG: hypothetical protein AOA66_1319 [Candidatus Bathyarchaeota archaeon BA2]|nr:MAG: hypothetical protein AOA66_1319 [Candidatus Bathyarchaeota archaeon BA2]